MAQPTPGDVHVNAPLTNIVVAFMQAATAFIAHRVFPVVPVEQQSNLYYQFTKEDFFRDQAKPRAPGTESAGGGFNLSTGSYSCLVEAIHKDIDDQLRANADSVLSLDRAAAEFCAQQMLIRRERRWATNFFTTGVWGTDVTPSTLWSAAAGDPMADVEVGKMAILATTGFMPNTIVMGAQVLSALRNNAKVRDQFKYTSAESINEAMIARYLGVERVFVMNSVYTSSVEGNATQTTQLIGGKHALLCYSAPSPSIMMPSAGYVFSWNGYHGASDGMRVKRFREERIASDRVEMESAYDFKKISAALGYFFNGAVA